MVLFYARRQTKCLGTAKNTDSDLQQTKEPICFQFGALGVIIIHQNSFGELVCSMCSELEEVHGEKIIDLHILRHFHENYVKICQFDTQR